MNKKNRFKEAGLKFDETIIGQAINSLTVGEVAKTIKKHQLPIAYFSVPKESVYEEASSFGFDEQTWLFTLIKSLNELWYKKKYYVFWDSSDEDYILALVDKCMLSAGKINELDSIIRKCR